VKHVVDHARAVMAINPCRMQMPTKHTTRRKLLGENLTNGMIFEFKEMEQAKGFCGSG
jgi:hypothetical protein